MKQDSKKFSKHMSSVVRKGWQDSAVRARRIAGIKKSWASGKRNASRKSVEKKIAAYWTEAQRAKHSKRAKKVLASPDVRRNMRRGQQQRWLRESEHTKYRKNMKTVMSDLKLRRRISLTERKQFAAGERKVPVMTGERFHSGWMKSKKGGVFFARSGWEVIFTMLLDSSRLVECFKYEPFVVQYRYDGVMRSYFPDFWVRFRNGKELVFELKGYEWGGRREQCKAKACERYCSTNGMEFVRLAGEDCNKLLRRGPLALTELVQ